MSIVYEVDKENGRVIAKFAEEFKSTNDIWFSAIMHTLNKVDCTNYDFSTLFDIAEETVFTFPIKVGIAKLHPNDEFNEEYGKEVARKKLVKRFRKAQIYAMHKLVDNITLQAERTAMRCMKKMQKLTNMP